MWRRGLIKAAATDLDREEIAGSSIIEPGLTSDRITVAPTESGDADPEEVREWLDSLDEMVEQAGRAQAGDLLSRLMERARQHRVPVPHAGAEYVNTLAADHDFGFPGDEALERRINSIVRWNAAAMVTRANLRSPGIGGHLSTYASAADLYEVGFNHFFRGKDSGHGDHVYFQGHSTPGIYARAFVEGRLTEADLDGFRAEVGGGGLCSYPHPRLMPTFWEFPTASMGLGVLNAIYQARFNRYLYLRGIKDTSRSNVWGFFGDGEMDEPEATAGLTLAARERLDNLVITVNCNLQRLDGPVRGNGKIVQELEALFAGAGWTVIKLLWGAEWDELLARDHDGLLRARLRQIPDGELQRCSVEGGAHVRQILFGGSSELAGLVAHLDDFQLSQLRRGGHDIRKIYAAFRHAELNSAGPTVILAQTVKGFGLGPAFEGRNATHQIKKLSNADVLAFRDRLELPISDGALADGAMPYYTPGESSAEVAYLRERRRALGGPVPARSARAGSMQPHRTQVGSELLRGTGTGEASTTGAFVRYLRNLMRDPELGRRVVPIVPDEARTFGMDALFHEFKIYSSAGQLYEPVDARHLISYREARDGQILEEGITEAGAMASMTAAGTAHGTHGEPMVPFFIFYSTFGFQRIADLIWAFGDARGRGFLLGGTAGRTTLNGEGLQHQDGHSPLLASTVPNLRVYDPAYAYELSVILDEGLRRMYVHGEDLFYYITLYNETYRMPPMPDAVRDGVLRGMYRCSRADDTLVPRAQLLGSGPMLKVAMVAQAMLRDDYGVGADVWSVTSYQELRRDALDVERWNRLHPLEDERVPYVTSALQDTAGPIVAVTDWMKAVADQAARWMPRRFTSLGTDGYGRSDTRDRLRRHFEVDAEHLVVATLHSLALDSKIDPQCVQGAIERYGLDTEAEPPTSL